MNIHVKMDPFGDHFSGSKTLKIQLIELTDTW